MIDNRLICRKINWEFLKFVYSAVLVKASGCCLTVKIQALGGLAFCCNKVLPVLPTHCSNCFAPQVSRCVCPDEDFSVNVWSHKHG